VLAAASPAAAAVWRCGRHALPLDRPLVMGILNPTPESFSDGGIWSAPDAAVRRAEALVDEGADILDLGAESTRPGAPAVEPAVELERLQPLLRVLHRLPLPVSIDTSQPLVMRAALDAGAAIINDVRALGLPGAAELVSSAAARECGIVLMHMQGTPATMQLAPRYDDVVGEVAAWLAQRVHDLVAAGVARARIVVDPGFGFGKTRAHNLALLARLGELAVVGVPVLVGLSRKSVLGMSQRPPVERTAASVAAALMAVERGARIVRVHDVAATRDALGVWQAVAEAARAP
jgi:dihydropteroate synthase